MQRVLSAKERSELFDIIATSPESDDIMSQTGGVRKIRVASEGQGKIEKANMRF